MSSSSDRFEDLDAVAVAQLAQRVLRAGTTSRPIATATRVRQAEHCARVRPRARRTGCAPGLAVEVSKSIARAVRSSPRDDTLRGARADARAGGCALAASGLGPAVAAIDLDALRANFALAAGRPPAGA
jgi:hypothetical protein